MTIKMIAATEESTYVATIQFFDLGGVPVAPKLASWTLKDENGSIVNSRNQIDIPTPATSNVVVLTGADLKLTDTTKPKRYLLVEALYDSVLYGNDLNLREEGQFTISNLVAKV